MSKILNPEPPEPPVGAEVAQAHRPTEVLFRHTDERGWRMPEWDHSGGAWPELRESWDTISREFGPLVLVERSGDTA